jgi:2'-5' RNA ligase
MIRLFTALEIPDAIAERLTGLQQGIENARWIERENFHITLRFLGDVPEDVADEADQALEKIPFTPFSLSLEGVGVFGGTKPHAVYAGVKPNEALNLLQARHESAMRRIGLKPEPRRFTPHVTLARLHARELDEAYRFQMAHNLFATPEFEVRRFILYSARSHVGGGPYVPERFYPSP